MAWDEGDEWSEDILSQFGAGETPAQRRARQAREAAAALQAQQDAIERQDRRQETPTPTPRTVTTKKKTKRKTIGEIV